MRHAIVLVVTAFVAACAGAPPPLSEIDAGGGITHVRPQTPSKFTAMQPGLAVPGADFLFVAPVGVSRRGALKHYLWLGARSTVDRGITGAKTPTIDAVILIADGTPVRLDVEPWEQASEAEVFDTGLLVTDTLAARVTMSQLDWLARATAIDIVTVDSTGRETRYASRDDFKPVFGSFQRATALAASSSNPQ